MYGRIGKNLSSVHSVYEESDRMSEIYMGLINELLTSQKSTLLRNEREMIAAYVSRENNCDFCYKLHRSVATVTSTVHKVHDVLDNGDYSKFPQMAVFADICNRVIKKGNNIDAQYIAEVTHRKIPSVVIHEVIAIASAICSVNRYVQAIGLNNENHPFTFFAEYAEKVYKHGY